MNKEFNCDIHTNYPVLLVDLLKDASKKLKCGTCISDSNQQMNFLFIPDIKNHKEDTFFKTWPPLSDENLRKKIIELKNEHIDYNEKIIQFYEQFKKQIDQILSDKMKQQLLDAQKIYDFKDKIIEQYCKLAEIKKLNECLNQENKQTIQIEEDLKQIIDSQFSKINEYTSILSNMMKQYELINQLNFENPNQVKNDIFKILETINVIPQNNFNFSEEADMFSIERFDIGYPYVQKQGNTLLIQISIQDKLLQYGGFCKQPIFEKASNSSNINTKHQYYFGIQFNNESGGDIIDIISFNELEEFS